MSTFGTDGTVRQQGVPDSMFGNFQLSGIYCSKSAYNAFFNLVDQACAVYANLEIWGTPTMENSMWFTTANRLAKPQTCCLLCKQAQETIQHLLIFLKVVAPFPQECSQKA